MIDKILADFFDFEKPCPADVPFCNQLRQKYQKELDKVNHAGCKACQRNNLKAKYMTEVWEKYVQQMIDQKTKELKNRS